MKRPIKWHENCLNNMQRSYDDKLRLYNKLEKELINNKKDILFYQNQIISAKCNNKDSFDETRYRIELKNKLGLGEKE